DPCTISCSSLRRMSTAGSLWSGYLTSVRLWPLSGPEKLAGDDHPLDLIGALVDLAGLGVAQPHRRGVGVGTAGGGADLPRGLGADPDPAAVETGHRQPEAAALGSDPVGGGDPHRLEDELGGRGPPQPELAQRAGGAHPGPRRLDEEGADPPRARAPGAGH